MLNLTLFLCIVWALSLLYGEWFAYLVPSIWTCSWPHQRPSSSSLMDRTSLRLPPKSFALEFAQFYTDLYMRRAFLSSVLPLKPDVVLFLGDYFDGGPILSDEEWQESLGRLRHIFNLNMLQKSSNTKVYYLSGNHDIGYSAFNSRKLESLVLSAHDHDQCTVTHRSKNGPVIEQTVGTVSWQQGNLYPSFMLLSASNSTLSDGSSPENAASSQLCFLPMQTHIYLWYLSLFAMTLVIVLLWPANEVLILRKLGELMGCIRSLYNSFSNTMKEKNEDENCEYEEIWDAEGTMHLIKKKKKVSSVVLNERSSVERGNIVMRSKVRKQTGQETDASTPDESIHVGSARTNKSKAKIMIWRLLRASRAILTIAAFNVPLYVLLSVRNQAASIHNGTSLHGWKSSEQNRTRIFCFVGRYSMSVVEERKSVSVAVPF
ncbi:UNVERIFIED_CONTAM: hypothetical protein Scaly_2563900 [Sesamum calycinum]|uniref:Calcineurin-like phosphoesterase domain-containing protein n=1 Tax=Sesamum calycinum TaxID=2727403 RepID=A0AAW2K7K2_9LAMI